MIKKYRKPNTFEIILLVIGLLILVTGLILIRKAIVSGPESIEILQTMFLWLILVGIIILVAVNENIKEEIKDLLKEMHKKKSQKR
ncbi:hypothetical protein DRJ17_03335 [Candidatus Woesearchaeota archaeon]|nr:MAG: hypothetical protein DRJ17_03335 [Candidatus Woesearchaeota archaeon]